MYGFENPEVYEPTELEVKMNELIMGEVENRIKQTVENLKASNKRVLELSERNRELSLELFKLKRDYQSELEKALKEKELEVHRSLSVGFAVNDVVYYIDSNSKRTKCDKCNGKGEVPVEVFGKPSKAKCPFCHYGNIIDKTYYPKKDTISSIKFYISRADRNDKRSVGVLKEDWGIELLLENRDSYVDGKTLYKTLEDCQAACDELNNKGSGDGQ